MKKRLIKWLAAISILLVIQVTGYFTIAPHLLRYKLLPDYFANLSHNSDSVFVRDFYVADCYVGDYNTYFSHNLSEHEDELKKKLRVKYVHFQTKENFEWNDTQKYQYGLTYTTWARRRPLSLSNIFEATQTEQLVTDKYSYQRQATYHWCLFFWIGTFEWFTSHDLSIRRGSAKER